MIMLLSIVSFQQEYVLSELEEYTKLTPTQEDSACAQHVLTYLKACHKIFERGILEKAFIKSTQSPLPSSIKDGFKFFSE